MEVIRTPGILQDVLAREKRRGRSIGFVPTMGALHEGHLTLVRISKQENDITVASIFVNPAQFSEAGDFEKYPRDTEADITKLERAGVETLFMPDAAHMYPPGSSTTVEVAGVSDRLCGAFRPGHFKGVATVVAKLMNIVNPTRAYFGRKDFQQCLVVKRLVADLNMGIEVVTIPTIREHDGLAMSSRNLRLNPAERLAAVVLFRALEQGEKLIKSGGSDIASVNALMLGIIKSEPLVKAIDYIGAYDPATLEDLSEAKREVLLAGAVRIGDIRLIDNMLAEMRR